MAMENEPVEDVFPIENGIFHGYVSLPEGIISLMVAVVVVVVVVVVVGT